MKELEKDFYRQAYDADKRLQEKMARELEAYHNREAGKMLEEYEKKPDGTRAFWERLKDRFFFFF